MSLVRREAFLRKPQAYQLTIELLDSLAKAEPMDALMAVNAIAAVVSNGPVDFATIAAQLRAQISPARGGVC